MQFIFFHIFYFSNIFLRWFIKFSWIFFYEKSVGWVFVCCCDIWFFVCCFEYSVVGLQGTEIKNSTSDEFVNGNLQVLIYDALSVGNLIYDEIFSEAIVEDSWNVMLVSNVDLPLEFGKEYYKDYLIDDDGFLFVS